MANQWDLCSAVVWQLIYGILMLVTVVGNLLILTAMATTARLRVKANVYIGALAVADLTVGLSRVITILWLQASTHSAFDENYWLCQGYAAITFVACIASIIILLIIATDRFVFIMYPFVYDRAVTTRKVVVVMVSLCPVYAVHAAMLRFFETSPDIGCDVNIAFPKTAVSTYVHIVLYCIINLTIFTLNALIFRKASRQARAIDTMIMSTQLGGGNREQEKRRISHNVRLVKRMALVWGIFCTLWTPYFMMSVIRLHRFVPGDVKLSVSVLGPFNSAFNIAIYAYQDHDFRAAFKRMLGKVQCPSEVSDANPP